MVLGKSTRLVLAPSGSCERQNLAWKGDWASPGDTRTTPGELVGRSSMGRGAKSKGFVRLSRLAVGVTSQSKLLLRQRKFPLAKRARGRPRALFRIATKPVRVCLRARLSAARARRAAAR